MARKPPGATVRNGYGARHKQLRKRWAAKVAAGQVVCWRCRERIKPGQKWHLGHDDYDRRFYRGPEHASCNCGTGRRQQMTPPPKALNFFK